MPLTAGSLDAAGNFVDPDCMARFIDDALPDRPDFGKRERREFLIAVAAGVIGYLQAHDGDSFRIRIRGHGRPHPATLEIT